MTSKAVLAEKSERYELMTFKQMTFRKNFFKGGNADANVEFLLTKVHDQVNEYLRYLRNLLRI